MNTLFTLKTSVTVLLLVVCQLSLKAQTQPVKPDTTVAKRADSRVKITADTTLFIRTGATIITKADTTFVINTDNKGEALFHSSQSGAVSAPPAGAPPAAGVAVPAATTGIASPAATTGAGGTTPAATAAGNNPANAVNTPGATPAVVPLAKKDSSLAVKTDSVKVKKDTSLVAKTDSLNTDTVTNIEKRARVAFLEVGGPGLAISGNFDMRFSKKNNGLGFRIGAGGFISGGNKVFTIPLQLNYLYGEGDHLLELGAGTTFLHSTGDNKGHFWQFDNITGLIATGTIGYRYQPVDGRLNLRIAFVPILYDEGLMPIGGISVGYSF